MFFSIVLAVLILSSFSKYKFKYSLLGSQINSRFWKNSFTSRILFFIDKFSLSAIDKNKTDFEGESRDASLRLNEVI